MNYRDDNDYKVDYNEEIKLCAARALVDVEEAHDMVVRKGFTAWLLRRRLRHAEEILRHTLCEV